MNDTPKTHKIYINRAMVFDQGVTWTTVAGLYPHAYVPAEYGATMQAERDEWKARSEKAEAECREAVLQSLASMGQAADAYEAQLRAEAALDMASQMLSQIFGMAGQGADAPNAAYRWCERIDEVIHHGPMPEYEAYAVRLPQITTARAAAKKDAAPAAALRRPLAATSRRKVRSDPATTE